MSVENTAVARQPQTAPDLNVDEDVTEIDLVELGYLLLDRIHMIVLFFLAGALLLNAWAYFLIEPTYESMARLYVVSSSSDSVVDLSDLNLGTSLTADYEVLILSYPVLNQVIDKLDLDMTYEELEAMVELSNPSDTRILNIVATSTDPQLACDIANTLAEVAVDYLPKTMSTLEPNIAQEAVVADHKAAPSYTRFTIIGAVLGAVLYCAFVIFMHLLDDTVHTAEDMERYFGTVPLSSIPESDALRENDGEKEEKPSRFPGIGKRGHTDIRKQ